MVVSCHTRLGEFSFEGFLIKSSKKMTFNYAERFFSWSQRQQTFQSNSRSPCTLFSSFLLPSEMVKKKFIKKLHILCVFLIILTGFQWAVKSQAHFSGLGSIR